MPRMQHTCQICQKQWHFKGLPQAASPQHLDPDVSWTPRSSSVSLPFHLGWHVAATVAYGEKLIICSLCNRKWYAVNEYGDPPEVVVTPLGVNSSMGEESVKLLIVQLRFTVLHPVYKAISLTQIQATHDSEGFTIDLATTLREVDIPLFEVDALADKFREFYAEDLNESGGGNEGRRKLLWLHGWFERKYKAYRDAFNRIKSYVSDAINLGKAVISTTEGIITEIKKLPDKITTAIEDVVQEITDAPEKLLTQVRNWFLEEVDKLFTEDNLKKLLEAHPSLCWLKDGLCLPLPFDHDTAHACVTISEFELNGDWFKDLAGDVVEFVK
eukprot:853091-Pyramimonas_sp.AAC.1